MIPTITVQPVHFEDFDGRNFERLVLAFLVNKYPECKFRWFGIVGKDEGRDIWGESKTGQNYCYQCTTSTLTYSKIQKDIDKICKSKKGRPNSVIVISGGAISASLQEKIEEYAHNAGIKNMLCWSGSQFEEYLRQDYEILLKRFCQGETFPDHPRELRFLINEPNPVPEDIKESLMTNLISIKKLPDKVYSAATERNAGEIIFKDLSNPPPFFVLPLEKRLYNFRPFNLDNPFSKYVEVSSQTNLEIEGWKSSDEGRRLISRIVNSWCRWACFRAGLSRDNRTQRYYYKSPDGQPLMKTWNAGRRAGKRHIIIRYEKKNGELYCIAHQAVNIGAFWFDNKICISILPEWVFTLDGSTPEDGQSHTKFERKFRSSKMTRNPAYRLHNLFWFNMILKDFQKRVRGLDRWAMKKHEHDPESLEVGAPLQFPFDKGIDEKKLRIKEEQIDEDAFLPTIDELTSEESEEEEEQFDEEEED